MRSPADGPAVYLSVGLSGGGSSSPRFVSRDAMLRALGGDGVRVYGTAMGIEGGSLKMSVGNLAAAAEKWADESPGLVLRILLSYHYYRTVEVEALATTYFGRAVPDIFLDSGAYSAATQGAPISLVDYIQYVQRNRHLLTTYANLDVIGDADATRVNQQRMEDAGLSPLPVFHFGGPWSALEWYLERYPYIALGGLVGGSEEAQGRWILQCFKLAGDRAVFHGFGMTNWQLLKAFRWYSVDSSSWSKGFRYGKVPVFDSRAGRFGVALLGDAASCYKLSRQIRELGFDPADFADRSRNSHDKICAISALSFMTAERWLRRRWGAVEIPGASRPPGASVYLADSAPWIFGQTADGINAALGAGGDAPAQGTEHAG